MCDWTGSLPVLVNMPLQADYDVTSIMAAGVQRLNDAVDDDNIYQLDRDEDDNVADLKIFIKACFGLDA